LSRHEGALPAGLDEPVFSEPWQAEAFAMTVALHDKGLFSWSEWASTLSHAIREAQAAGDPDFGETYYEHWLAALEKTASDKGLVTRASLMSRREQWRLAAKRTPHGQPILLETAERSDDGI